MLEFIGSVAACEGCSFCSCVGAGSDSEAAPLTSVIVSNVRLREVFVSWLGFPWEALEFEGKDVQLGSVEVRVDYSCKGKFCQDVSKRFRSLAAGHYERDPYMNFFCTIDYTVEEKFSNNDLYLLCHIVKVRGNRSPHPLASGTLRLQKANRTHRAIYPNTSHKTSWSRAPSDAALMLLQCYGITVV